MPHRSLTLPTYWATYLFYGSTDAVDAEEIETIETVLACYKVRRNDVVGMDEVGYSAYSNAAQFGVLAGDVAEYHFHIEG